MKTRLIKTGIGYSLNTLQKAATLKASHDKSSTKNITNPQFSISRNENSFEISYRIIIECFFGGVSSQTECLRPPRQLSEPLRQPTLVTVKYKSKQKQMQIKTKTNQMKNSNTKTFRASMATNTSHSQSR